MAEPHETRSRAKAWAAEIDAARRRAGLLLPDWLSGAPPGSDACCRNGRWRKRRPAGWCPGCRSLSVSASSLISAPSANRPGGRHSPRRLPAWLSHSLRAGARSVLPLALGFAAIAAGFATATLRTARIAHPVLAFPLTASVNGFVEMREERARSDRIVVRVQAIEARRLDTAAAARTRRGAQRHRACGRQFRLLQGASGAAARALAARRLRLRARYVFPKHRRLRLCAGQDHACRRRRTRAAGGCATRRRSTPCARASTSASTRCCRATAARSPRR